MRKNIAKLIDDIMCEGFDYALNDYDDYSDIPDDKFQELYVNYLNARAALVDYLGVDA